MVEATIRRLEPADAAAFRDIRLEGLLKAAEAFSATYEMEFDRPIEFFAQRLVGAIVLGAYIGDRIVGTAGLLANIGSKERHKTTLVGMYVRAEQRGQGVGAALIQAILDRAPDGVEQILLKVVAGNDAARALYARLGFVTYGVEPRALKTPQGYVDDVLMVRFLNRT